MSTATNLFDRFGGIRPMAEAVGEAPSTVQSWKNVGRIPATKQPDVLAAAERRGILVTAEDVVFPMGRGDSAADAETSATISSENIRGREGGPGHPFSATSSSSSPTNGTGALEEASQAPSCPVCSPGQTAMPSEERGAA